MGSRIVVIGGSAGSLDPIKKLVSLLPDNFNAPVLIVIHMARHKKSMFSSILSRYSKLPVITATNGAELKHGHVYVCVPNLHMKVVDGKIALENGPTINHCRPAIDPLFYSVSAWYGACTIGVLLSGFLEDGTAGLFAIKKNNGTAIVQDLEEAEYSDMPRNALSNVDVDFCLKTTDIASKLIELVNQPLPPAGCRVAQETLEQEITTPQVKPTFDISSIDKIGYPSGFSCPICQGVLWEIIGKQLVHFCCQIGHVFSIKSLTEAIEEKAENTLWNALRALEEKEILTLYIEEKISDNETKKNILHQLSQDIKQQIKTMHHILKNENSILDIF